MAKLNDLIVTIGATTKDFDKALGKSMRKMRTFGKNTKQLGKNMTMGLTAPIAALGITAVKAFDQQAKAIAQVEAGLKSTGASVGFTSKQLQKMASDLQSKTLFGDEEILKDATAQLLTFTNITGDQFAKSQEAALNLATRLDGDLKSASIMLGKALNDPVANLSAMSRAGIQFSEDQKEVIKSLAESGDMAQAQSIILGELEKQYGGSAEAAAKAGTGGLKQLANAFGDLQEEFGKIIMQFLPPVIDGLKNMLAAFQNLSPQAKRFMVIGSGIAAALGPLLVIMPLIIQGVLALAGVIASVFTSAIAGASTAMAFLITPIGAVIGVIALLVGAILTFSEEASKPLADVINFFIRLYNEIDFVRVIVGFVKGVVQNVFDFFGFAVASVIAAFKDLGSVILAIFKGDFSLIPELVSKAFSGAAERMKEFGEKAAKNVKENIESELQRDPYELVTSDQVLDGINKVKGFADQAKDFIAGIFSGGGGAAAGDGGMQPLTPQGVGSAIPQPQLIAQASTAVGDMAEGQEDLNNEIGISINMASKMEAAYVGIGMALGGLITGTMTMADVFGQAIAGLANLLIDLGAQFIAAGVAATAFYANLIANPPLAIAAGVGLVAAGAVIKGLQARMQNSPPALAQGGLAFGPTLAMVGDNQGAGVDPEVIAPLSKLRDMMGGQQVQVTGKISGRDILLTSERNSIDRNRVRGF